MAHSEPTVPLAEAKGEVEIAVTRLALLHLSFSRTLVEELGEKKGKELIVKSICEYGKRIGARTRQGHRDLPKYGVTGKFEDGKAYDCVLGRTFQENGEEEIGCLYCYVDPAKSMAVDPGKKLVHKTSLACGDEDCSFAWLPTTPKERKDFADNTADWRLVDPRLDRGSKPE